MKVSFPVRIYLAALLLRVIPVLLTRGLGIGLDDMFQYDMLARSLAAGNGFRWYAQEDLKLLEPYVDFDLSTAKGYDPEYGMYTSFRAPLYPAFLAVVYFLNGLDFSRFLAARLVQAALLGAPLAPLTYWVARRMFPAVDRDARIAAWIVAAYPMLLVYPLGLGTENLFFVLLLALVLFLLKALDEPSRWNLVFFGLFLALTALTRSVILPFAALALLYLVVVHKRAAWLAAFAFVVCIAPWVARNSLLHHKVVGIETSMGYNLYLGYHPQGNGSFVFGPSLDLLTIMDDAERDEVGTQAALGFIEDQPERFIPLALNRLGFFFGLEKRVLMYFYSNNLLGYIPLPLLLTVLAVLLLPFVILSISSAFALPILRWDRPSILLALLFGAYIVPHVFILAEDRFHLALVPYFAILAVQGWRTMFVPQVRASAKRSMLLAAVVLSLLLLTNWGLELARDADKISALLGSGGNITHFPY